MGLLDYHTQPGVICPRCIEKKRNGVLVIKSGKFGKFLGCDKYPTCTHTENIEVNLENEATTLLKGTRKKTRRGSRIKRKMKRQRERKKLLDAYNKQKKERAQMFRDFERLIASD